MVFCLTLEVLITSIPANTIHLSHVGLMLARRLRRRPKINPALVQCIVFAGSCPQSYKQDNLKGK